MDYSPISFIFVNIHICMLIFTPQFDVFFIYYAHAYLFTLVLFVYLLLKRAPRKIGYQPIGLPSQNKEFTYLLTYLQPGALLPEEEGEYGNVIFIYRYV